ncbi:hypothetical protein BOX15_Mlig032237g2, partial [Macrostomum lignano]
GLQYILKVISAIKQKMSSMYTCHPFVDSGKKIASLPTCMYTAPNLVSVQSESAELDASTIAATEINICYLERLRGDLATLIRVRNFLSAATAGVAEVEPVPVAAVKSTVIQSVSSKTPPQKPELSKPAAASSVPASHAPSAAPVSLALHCSTSRPPLAVLLLVELLRSRQGISIYLTSHGRVLNGSAARPASPAVNRLIHRLSLANPPRRMSADICLDLIWSTSDKTFNNDCCLINNAFSGQPLLGELLALQSINLVVKQKLPVDQHLLDLADHLQTGRRVSEQLMAELLAKNEDSKQSSLGQLLAWSVLQCHSSAATASSSTNGNLAAASKRFLAKLNSAEPFSKFVADLTAK